MGAILTPCETCKTIGEHTPDCVESAVAKARREDGWLLSVCGMPCVIRTVFDARGWRAEWEIDGESSRTRPIGGLEESRYPTADVALANAFADALPALRMIRKRYGG